MLQEEDIRPVTARTQRNMRILIQNKSDNTIQYTICVPVEAIFPVLRDFGRGCSAKNASCAGDEMEKGH